MRQLLIADDHPICAAAFEEAALSVDSATTVTIVESLSDAKAALRTGNFAAMILDLTLADRQGLSNVSTVRAAYPDLPILVVSGSDVPAITRRVAVLGARGFLSKKAPIAQMRSAVTVVLEGGSYFPGIDGSSNENPPLLEQLSPAQTKVTIELARGHSNKIIAHQLSLSEATVKSHLSAIYRRLNVSNRSQAILALQQSRADAA